MWYAALLGALVQIVGTLVGKVLVSLGIGYASYTGLDVAMTYAKNQFFNGVGGLDPSTVQLLGALQVGTCVNMVASALIARLTLHGMVSGAVKRMVLK